MKQRISAVITVEFDNDIPQKDVDEAVIHAVSKLQALLIFAPAVKGASLKREVSFKIRDVELAP